MTIIPTFRRTTKTMKMAIAKMTIKMRAPLRALRGRLPVDGFAGGLPRRQGQPAPVGLQILAMPEVYKLWYSGNPCNGRGGEDQTQRVDLSSFTGKAGMCGIGRDVVFTARKISSVPLKSHTTVTLPRPGASESWLPHISRFLWIPDCVEERDVP